MENSNKHLIMQFKKFTSRMSYLKALIRMEATGTPDQLATRLKLSKRMVYRYINVLSEEECRVEYCRKKRSYKFL